jgi:hypothetical protein
MLWQSSNFAPASAVEGITTESFLTNTPYFQTYIGDGESTYYYGSAVEQWFHSIPGGIKMGVWTGDDSDHYYWAMVGDYYFLNSIEDYGPITGGCVYDQDEILGLSDGYDAFIGGSNVYDGGYIWGEMSTPHSGGNIYLRVSTDSGYYSNVFVFVRNDPNDDWVPVCEALTIDNDYPDWIFVGTSVQSFRYISIVGLDWGWSVHLYIDAVKVGIGDFNNGYVESIVDSGIVGYSSSVTNENNLIGFSNDGQRANIGGANYGDGGYIIGEMNAIVGGHIYVNGYSDSGYYSNLYVYVSSDCSSWTQVGSYITVSQSTPYWIDIGVYLGGFRYITVMGYDTGNSVHLNLDCVRVQ